MCVCLCVCVCWGGCLWSLWRVGAGKPHPYGKAAPESPIFFHKHLPPTTTPNTSSAHSHIHTQLIYRKTGWGWASPDSLYPPPSSLVSFTEAKPQSASALFLCKCLLLILITFWLCFTFSHFNTGPPWSTWKPWETRSTWIQGTHLV